MFRIFCCSAAVVLCFLAVNSESIRAKNGESSTVSREVALRVTQNSAKVRAAGKYPASAAGLSMSNPALRGSGCKSAAFAAKGWLREARKAASGETGTFSPSDNTYPHGSHVCEVEIDAETGALE